jgi:hypothetical protein
MLFSLSKGQVLGRPAKGTVLKTMVIVGVVELTRVKDGKNNSRNTKLTLL